MSTLTGKEAVRIEPAQASDVNAIVAIGRVTFDHSFGYSMPAQDLQTYLDTTYSDAAMRAEFNDSCSDEFYVARLSDGSVAGFVQLKNKFVEPCLPTELRLLELHRLYVSMQHHGLGIGGKLIAHAIAKAKAQNGCQGMWLGVWEENVRAQKLYASQGFRERMGKHAFTMGKCVQWDEILLLRF